MVQNSNFNAAEYAMALGDKTRSIVEKFQYLDGDARKSSLNNFDSITRTCGMTLNLLHAWSVGSPQVVNNIPRILGIAEVSRDSVDISAKILETSAKHSLIVLGHFQFETLFRSIYKKFFRENDVHFSKLSFDLIKHLGMPERYAHEISVLTKMRNSLHSGGIYRKSKHEPPILNIQIGNANFKFESGSRIKSATWSNIYVCMENILDITDQIISEPRVAGIDGVLEVAF